MKWVIAFALAMAALAPAASARSLSELRGATFGEIGNLRPVRCPIAGGYDCLTFPRNLYEMNGTCFTLAYTTAVGGYEEAMVIQFTTGGFGLMVKSGFGDRFEIVDIERGYDCPREY